MKYILAYFGYCKIPLEVIQLSIKQEEIFKSLLELFKDHELNETIKLYLKGQQAITAFLRSGKF